MRANALQKEAAEDARRMRMRAIECDDLAERMGHLNKRNRRLEVTVRELKEEMRIKEIVHVGQIDILKKQQREAAEESDKAQRRLSATYDKEKAGLLETQAQIEKEKEWTRASLRAQTENALSLQAGLPKGTGVFSH
mmetsp:Transcript_17889/g.53028  ORF Transcript_17889/g.53028 Transcript_17889/m.53028 type:complete len:137 (+) Transcript_17889:899-1309(+)